MKRRLQLVDILPELRAHVARKYKTQKAAAKALGVSSTFVHFMLSGKKPPSQQLLDDAGINCMKTIVYYRESA